MYVVKFIWHIDIWWKVWWLFDHSVFTLYSQLSCDGLHCAAGVSVCCTLTSPLLYCPSHTGWNYTTLGQIPLSYTKSEWHFFRMDTGCVHSKRIDCTLWRVCSPDLCHAVEQKTEIPYKDINVTCYSYHDQTMVYIIIQVTQVSLFVTLTLAM